MGLVNVRLRVKVLKSDVLNFTVITFPLFDLFFILVDSFSHSVQSIGFKFFNPVISILKVVSVDILLIIDAGLTGLGSIPLEKA